MALIVTVRAVPLVNLPRTITTALRSALALCALALASCVEEPLPRLRVGTFLRPGFEPLFLARSLGHYDERRIQFVEFPTAAEMLLAYRNGAIDAATVTTDDVLRLAADGLEPRIVLVMNFSNGADAVLAKPAVHSLAALKGRKIGVESNGLGGYLLARALDSASLTLADVQIVSARADRVERDFAIDNVEAVATHEPHSTRVQRRPTVRLYDSASIPEEIAGVLIVSAADAAHPHPALRGLIEGWFHALDYLAAERADAIARMAPREALTTEQFDQALSRVSFVDRAENHRHLSAPDAPLAAGMKRMAAFMAGQRMLPHEIDPLPLRHDLFPAP